jgi:hypothetical protein
VVKLGIRSSGPEFGQAPPRLWHNFRFVFDANEFVRGKEGLMTLSERIRAQGPKPILALGSGGLRGIITLEIFARIESLLREK